MIIKSIGIGNLEEAYICKEFQKGLNVIWSDDNNKGKTIVIQSIMFCLGNTPAFPTGFEYEDYYYVLVIEQNSELIKICRKNKNFVIKINNEYAVFDNISEFKRYWNKNIEELPVIKKDNVWRIVDPELFVQLFFVGQDKKNTYDIVNKGWYKKEDFYKLDDKGIFNETFKEYIKRDFLIISKDNFDEFKKFTSKHKKIIAKIINGEGGKGISLITVNKNDKEKVFKELLKNNQTLIEEVIIQNKEISKLYSGSVNTLRLFTFYDGENAYVLNSVFKIGNGGVTDNFSSGSMYTFTDDDGVVIVPAIDQDDNIYEIHPITKEKIVGFKVPLYDEACKLVIEAAKLMPTIKYIGWDVAITDKSPVIIEGNSYPGVFQIKPSLTNNHTGLIPKYQKYMNIK